MGAEWPRERFLKVGPLKLIEGVEVKVGDRGENMIPSNLFTAARQLNPNISLDGESLLTRFINLANFNLEENIKFGSMSKEK